MDRLRIAFGLGLVLALGCFSAIPARAQDDEEEEPQITPRDPELEKQLEYAAQFQAGLEAITRRDLVTSERLFKRCIELRPEQAVSYYNLACTYSLMGKIEPAVQQLRAAFSRGFNDLSHMDRDTDLDALRKAPEYRALRGEMEAKVREGFPAPLTRLPAGSDPYPLLVYLHDDRARPDATLARLAETLDAGWGIFVPQGPIDLQRQGGRAWDDRAEWLVLQAVSELLAANPRVDRTRVVVVGEGISAHRALNLTVHHPDLFTGAVAGGPYLSAGIDPELSAKSRVYLVVHQDDPGEVQGGVEARDRLCDHGTPVVLERYPRARGLSSDRALLLRAIGWVGGQSVKLPGAGVELGF